MADGKLSGIHIDPAALEEAAKSAPQARAAVNQRARQIQQVVQGMSAGFKTGRFYDRPSKELRGNKSPQYGMKPATSTQNPHAIVHTANYAAMKFELDNNGLAKASR